MPENQKHMGTSGEENQEPKRKEEKVEVDELEKDDLEDVSGGETISGIVRDKNCGC